LGHQPDSTTRLPLLWDRSCLPSLVSSSSCDDGTLPLQERASVYGAIVVAEDSYRTMAATTQPVFPVCAPSSTCTTTPLRSCASTITWRLFDTENALSP